MKVGAIYGWYDRLGTYLDTLESEERQAKAMLNNLTQNDMDKMIAYARQKGWAKSDADAIGLINDAWIRGQHLYKGEAEPVSYLLGIVRKVWIDNHRRAKADKRGGRENVISFDDPGPGDGSYDPTDPDALFGLNPLRTLILKETAARYADAIAALTERHRQTVKLAAEGESYENIAALTDVSIGTVMSRLHYARKKLQKAVAVA